MRSKAILIQKKDATDGMRFHCPDPKFNVIYCVQEKDNDLIEFSTNHIINAILINVFFQVHNF